MTTDFYLSLSLALSHSVRLYWWKHLPLPTNAVRTDEKNQGFFSKEISHFILQSFLLSFSPFFLCPSTKISLAFILEIDLIKIGFFAKGTRNLPSAQSDKMAPPWRGGSNLRELWGCQHDCWRSLNMRFWQSWGWASNSRRAPEWGYSFLCLLCTLPCCLPLMVRGMDPNPTLPRETNKETCSPSLARALLG